MYVDKSHMHTVPSTERAMINPTIIPLDVAVKQQQRFDDISLHDHAYLVGAHDAISISVWNHPEFGVIATASAAISGDEPNAELSPQTGGASFGEASYLVAEDGSIFVPLIGKQYIAGKTVEQIQIQLTHALMKYIPKPQLQVRIAGFRSQKVYLVGEVAKPGVQRITDMPLTVTEALSTAGGVLPDSSDPQHIYIFRGPIDNPKAYLFNAKSPDALLLAENFQLRGNDVIYVPAAASTTWNRGLNQILPTIQTIWFTASLVNNR